ncbi:leucine-rich repeat-containing protein 15-like isoform X2 [Octopus sinensis]|uniref:Leucine-rich repeat-containing protein 15-like isoform X2 n=1 Tax=Octopus sinensis TaxID=2607531 RepID=A0A7E6F2J2_9MOLL|nr:leucine-rich repeat-containing protein 15-like isoform X2 [Octopus sinensis]
MVKVNKMGYLKSVLFWLQLMLISGTGSLPVEYCPKSCVCKSGYTSCSRLNAFPLDLPSISKSVLLTEMSIEEIPANALLRFPDLTLLRIENSDIHVIRSDAFKNISNLEELSFSVCNIDRIETNAFNHLWNQTVIQFHNVTIKTIKKHAFSNIFNLREWTIFESTIHDFQTEAIHQVSNVYTFSIYSNQIGRLGTAIFSSVTNVRHVDFFMNDITDIGCNVFDFSTNEFSNFEFYGNTFTCGCNLFGLSKGKKAIYYTSSSSSTKRDSPVNNNKMLSRRVDSAAYNSISLDKWSFDELLYRNWCVFKDLKQKISLENYRSSDEVICQDSPCFSSKGLKKNIDIYRLNNREPSIPVVRSGSVILYGISTCFTWSLLLTFAC